MSRFRASLTCLLLLLVAMAGFPAAPLPRPPIALWIEELGSEDADVSRAAVEKLWRAGDDSLPALRKAEKNTDPDIVLRARLVLARLEWGIYSNTPPAVLAEIQRFRDGDVSQKRAAVVQLSRLGWAGYRSLRLLLSRVKDAQTRTALDEAMKEIRRPTARFLIATGNLAEAEQALTTAAQTGNEEAILDLSAFLVTTGKAREKLRELENASVISPDVARRGAYLHRAMGDLKSARRLAEISGDSHLLSGILDELEDYVALAKNPPVDIAKRPGAMAALLWRAGDHKGFDDALKRVQAQPDNPLATVCFFNDLPHMGIRAYHKLGLIRGTCNLLEVQGRWREALALEVPPNNPGGNVHDETSYLLCEKVRIAHLMGEEELALGYLQATLKNVEKGNPHPGRTRINDYALGELLRISRRMGRFDRTLTEIGQLLDRAGHKPPTAPWSLIESLSSRDTEAMSVWWEFFRKRKPDMATSAILEKLNDWFVKGKGGKELDDLLADWKDVSSEKLEQRERAALARARSCVATNQLKLAEQVYEQSAKDIETVTMAQALGKFHFERKRWADAARAFALAVKHDPTAWIPLYLNGVALKHLGRVKEGEVLIGRARVLGLAEESAHYSLGNELRRLGMLDEAAQEYLTLTRTATFRSIYTSNVVSSLADHLEKKGRYSESARYYRRLGANHAFLTGGSFLNARANLWVPGWAHQLETKALLSSGKLDAALEEARLFWKHMPEGMGLSLELVLAFDRAGRKADADRLFDEVFARLQRACVEAPRCIERLNRLSWLAARCGRKLDSALPHARRATELRPTSAGLFDTLAEVQFQRGKQDSALAAIREAVKLAPTRKYFAAQLRRIQAGNPKAALPPENE
jgi:tetratricopeptide (TPR) repeat protein